MNINDIVANLLICFKEYFIISKTTKSLSYYHYPQGGSMALPSLLTVVLSLGFQLRKCTTPTADVAGSAFAAETCRKWKHSERYHIATSPLLVKSWSYGFHQYNKIQTFPHSCIGNSIKKKIHFNTGLYYQFDDPYPLSEGKKGILGNVSVVEW